MGRASARRQVLEEQGVASWSMLHGYITLRLDGAQMDAPTTDELMRRVVELTVRMTLLPA